jgi:hypothetical protein
MRGKENFGFVKKVKESAHDSGVDRWGNTKGVCAR